MENSLHYKLRICHTNCQKSIVTDIKHKTDLRPGEPKILEFLAEHEPCEQKVIAAGCNLDSASVTGILGRMEKRELIKRETKNGNRRSLYVSRTNDRSCGRDIYIRGQAGSGRAYKSGGQRTGTFVRAGKSESCGSIGGTKE